MRIAPKLNGLLASTAEWSYHCSGFGFGVRHQPNPRADKPPTLCRPPSMGRPRKSSAMKYYLIVAKGKKQGLPIPIMVDLFMIGSGKVCQLRAKHKGIGEQQCAIVRRERKIFVRDLGSDFPTMLNGSLVPPGEEWPLHAGDRLEVGRMAFLAQFREKPLSQRDLEEWALRCLDHNAELDINEPIDDFRPQTFQATNAAQAAAAIFDCLQAKRGIVQGRLRVGRDGTVTIVRFNDMYLVEEAEIALVSKELHDTLNKANLRVLLDCKNVRRMSTTAVAMIDELFSWLKPWGSSMALCRVRPELHDILGTLHLRNSIPHYPDKKVALASRW
jgi:anti-anti-sigma regulatory factor